MTDGWNETITIPYSRGYRWRLRWWRFKGLVDLAWRTRRWNPFVWVTAMREVRRIERAYNRDLERAAFYGPDYDQ